MIKGVSVQNNGTCESVKVTLKKKKIFVDDKELFVHYVNEFEKLLIVSKYTIDETMQEDFELFEFYLPPPLNQYIYPKDIIILKGSPNKPETLTCSSFIEHCTKFKADIVKIEANLTVYDVPLDETTYEDEESENDDEELYDEIYDEDEVEEQDEEDDWDDDDDDVVN